MNQEYIRGIGHQLLGAAKSGAGRLIGDAKLKADGAAEQLSGKAESLAARSGAIIPGIDQDRIDGIGLQLKGAAEQGYGRIVNDREIEAAGKAKREAGKLQNEAGSERDEKREAERKASEAPKP